MASRLQLNGWRRLWLAASAGQFKYFLHILPTLLCNELHNEPRDSLVPKQWENLAILLGTHVNMARRSQS